MEKNFDVQSVADIFPKIKKMIKDDFRKELALTGQQIADEAQLNSPFKTGYNHDHITYSAADDGYTAKISAASGYGAYLEFGTGTNVDIPVGYEDLAMQFKGKGVRQINLPARPYLIPAAVKHYDLLFEKLWKIYDSLL